MIMKTRNWKKWIAGAMSAVMLASSLPELQASAAETSAQDAVAYEWDAEQESAAVELLAAEEISSGETEESAAAETETKETLTEETGTETKETATEESGTEETATEESGTKESATEESGTKESATEESATNETVTEESGTAETAVEETATEETATEETATEETLTEDLSADMVSIKVDGAASVEGVSEDGTAKLGSEVSIKVLKSGYTLVRVTKDKKGNDIYTAMELDYDNTYRFTVEEAAEFVVVNPEQVDYNVLYGDTRKAKLTGTAGIKLNGLTSSAQGYKEVVLNFNAVKNGSDGTETENVFYEVKVTAAAAGEGEQVPAGSPVTPKYYYIPKTADTNTQSKSIQVNNGDLSASTAWNYEFSVRMVLIDKNAKVPEEDTAVDSPLEVSLSGNTLTKTFATKNLYYEDKLGFTKKTTKIIAGQQDVLVGIVKYSKNASYLHDMTAVAYDSTGAVCEDITCTIKNDNDELYVSTDEYMVPGKYNVVVYAGIGEEVTADSPQSGTMYQATATVALTVEAGITYIDTSKITKYVAVYNKDINFSTVPVGYGSGVKTKYQKFTYEIKSAEVSGSSYTVTDPVEKVKNNISVNAKGKVTVKKGYYVDPDTSKNYFAVVIHAVDYEENETTATVYVQVSGTVLVPTKIYLASSASSTSSLGTTLAANKADGAYVIVVDQYGNNMNQYVTITPSDNVKYTAGMYVSQYSGGTAQLWVRKPGTITIKATSTQGSKRSMKVTIKVNKVTSATDASYSLDSVTSDGFSASELKTTKGQVTYSAPRGAEIRYRQSAFKEGSYNSYHRSWYDWGYEVTGGKLKFDGDYWVLTPTAKTAKVTIWLKSNPKKTWYLNFTNSNWETTYDAAQKITLTDGKLYSSKYTNASELKYYSDSDYDYEYYDIPAQELTYRYEYGSYDSVKIARISSSAPYLSVEDFDPENRTFKLTASAYSTLKAGSYKYKVAFYTDGVLMSKPSTITVKVTKSSPVKVTSSYTLNTAQSDRIELKCSTKEFVPDFETQLLNANVGGKANDFNKYFELENITDEQTGARKAVIKFKSTVTEEEKAALKGKSIAGYVKYSYYYGYSHVENVTTKVTIKIK
jgi:hypothetical protein